MTHVSSLYPVPIADAPLPFPLGHKGFILFKKREEFYVLLLPAVTLFIFMGCMFLKQDIGTFTKRLSYPWFTYTVVKMSAFTYLWPMPLPELLK